MAQEGILYTSGDYTTAQGAKGATYRVSTGNSSYSIEKAKSLGIKYNEVPITAKQLEQIQAGKASLADFLKTQGTTPIIDVNSRGPVTSMVSPAEQTTDNTTQPLPTPELKPEDLGYATPEPTPGITTNSPEQQAQQQEIKKKKVNNIPEGWDAQTYANFKSANPTLEPDAQDTAMMLGAGQPGQIGAALNNIQSQLGMFQQAKDLGMVIGPNTDLSEVQSYLRQRGVNTGRTGGTSSPTDSGFSTPTGEGTSAPSPVPTSPTSFIQTYKDIIKQLGLTDIKKEFEKVTKEQKAVQDELADKIADINENPWLSEGVRVNSINKLKERYETKLAIAQNKIQIYDSLYKEGAQQAQFLATGVYQEQKDAAALAEKRWEAQQKLAEFDPSTYKEINGGLYDLKQQRWIVEPSAAGGGTNDIKEYQLAQSQGYTGTFLDWQRENANLKARVAGAGSNALSSAQMNSTINAIAGSFDNEQIVKNYNTAQEGYQTISSIGVNTKNPADDIAFIYAFAKIMDPNSVVREGEYNTIQRYAQSWAQTFGFNAARIFSNTNFLGSDAKQKMLDALRPRINTLQTQYDNLYNQYQQRINTVQGGGFNSLTDYSAAFPTNTGSPTASGTATQADMDYINFIYGVGK